MITCHSHDHGPSPFQCDHVQLQASATHDPREHPAEDDECLLQQRFDKELGIQGGKGFELGASSAGGAEVSHPSASASGSVSEPLPLPPPPLASSEDLRQQWCQGFECGFTLLKDRLAANTAQPALGGVWPHELSLIATYSNPLPDPDAAPEPVTSSSCSSKLAPCNRYNDVKGNPVVLVIAWVDPNPNPKNGKPPSGRVCDVKEGKVLALVPARHMLLDCSSSNCEVILNSIGMRPHKEGKKSRPPLPPISAKLKQMWEVAFSRLYSSRDESVTLEPCIKCGAAGLAEHEDEAVFVCPICSIPWHRSCSAKLLATPFNFNALCSSGTRQFLPERFAVAGPNGHNAVCSLCEHVNSLCLASVS